MIGHIECVKFKRNSLYSGFMLPPKLRDVHEKGVGQKTRHLTSLH